MELLGSSLSIAALAYWFSQASNAHFLCAPNNHQKMVFYFLSSCSIRLSLQEEKPNPPDLTVTITIQVSLISVLFPILMWLIVDRARGTQTRNRTDKFALCKETPLLLIGSTSLFNLSRPAWLELPRLHISEPASYVFAKKTQCIWRHVALNDSIESQWTILASFNDVYCRQHNKVKTKKTKQQIPA